MIKHNTPLTSSRPPPSEPERIITLATTPSTALAARIRSNISSIVPTSPLEPKLFSSFMNLSTPIEDIISTVSHKFTPPKKPSVNTF